MDDLVGNTIYIILSIKEGQGFNAFRESLIISCSLNGHTLRTDPVSAKDGPFFDSELVWETDRRALRSLRLQNVPLKLQVLGKRGGYLTLSLRGARPCGGSSLPAPYAWHRLLGAKGEPQLLLRLTLHDTLEPASTSPPKHAGNSSQRRNVKAPPESPKAHLIQNNPTLQGALPRLQMRDGLVTIGQAPIDDVFKLSFALENAENTSSQECILKLLGQTLRMGAFGASLLVAAPLHTLCAYLSSQPSAVFVRSGPGLQSESCELDLCQMFPTDRLEVFESRYGGSYSCTYPGPPPLHATLFRQLREEESLDLTFNSHGSPSRNGDHLSAETPGAFKFQSPIPGLVQTPIIPTSAPTGEPPIPPPEQVPPIISQPEKVSAIPLPAQAPLMPPAAQLPPPIPLPTQVPSIPPPVEMPPSIIQSASSVATAVTPASMPQVVLCRQEDYPSASGGRITVSQSPRRYDCGDGTHELFHKVCHPTHSEGQLPSREVMMDMVNELEEWKEQQQEIFRSQVASLRVQLKQKEASTLAALGAEWETQRAQKEAEQNSRLHHLSVLLSSLGEATQQLSLQETKLRRAKEELEMMYITKYHELNEASKRIEDEFNHEMKLQEHKYYELQMKIAYVEKENASLKKNIKNQEEEIQSLKEMRVSSEKTAAQAQEMRDLQQRLEGALQSKSFFKHQWATAVREGQLMKLQQARNTQVLQQMLLMEESHLQQDHLALQSLKGDVRSLNHPAKHLNDC